MDLLEQTRMNDTYDAMSEIVDKIGNLGVFPPLVWVWCWDVLVSMYKDYEEGMDDEWVVTMPLKDVWALFYVQADDNGFTLEYGTEELYEHLRDWMIDNSIITELDGDEEDVLESDEEEV